MRLNPAPAEFSPLETPESADPELRLIVGGGEGTTDVTAPDLYIVPDSIDSVPEVDVPEQAVEEESESSIEEPLMIRQKTAKRAGRILRIITVSELTTSSGIEHRYRGGGGGGWAERELLKKKQAAKEQHESECVCQYCAA